MSDEIKRILVTGALGQIGSELVPKLREIYGSENVIASDLKEEGSKRVLEGGPFRRLDVLNFEGYKNLVEKEKIDAIFHLAAILSGVGEQNPSLCWNVNMNGSLNTLNVGVELKLKRIFIPSSIAVWGPDCPKIADQNSPLHPTTMYGVTKVSGELLGEYYFLKYGLDVRGLRYPGIISAETPPGGGTTDYAVEIFYEAVEKGSYVCFVNKDTKLPMMYMPDCVKATIDLFQAPSDKLKRRCDFNVASMSFDVETLAAAIKKRLPNFSISYKPDFRQQIADTWPDEADDSEAREQWGWSPEYDLEAMTDDMLEKIRAKLKK